MKTRKSLQNGAKAPMHSHCAEFNHFEPGAETELPQRFAREIKQVRRGMNLTPPPSPQARQERTEIPRAEKKMTSRIQEPPAFLDGRERGGQMFDGVPEADPLERPLDFQVEKITIARVQSAVSRLSRRGGGDVHPYRAGIKFADELEEESMGAPNFEQGLSYPHITAHGSQMALECSLVRGFVRDVVNVFRPFEIGGLIKLFRLRGVRRTRHGHQAASTANQEGVPSRSPSVAATGVASAVRRHGFAGGRGPPARVLVLAGKAAGV